MMDEDEQRKSEYLYPVTVNAFRSSAVPSLAVYEPHPSNSCGIPAPSSTSTIAEGQCHYHSVIRCKVEKLGSQCKRAENVLRSSHTEGIATWSLDRQK